jgi:hypothetical protein
LVTLLRRGELYDPRRRGSFHPNNSVNVDESQWRSGVAKVCQ